jgi:hypothetical protein
MHLTFWHQMLLIIDVQYDAHNAKHYLLVMASYGHSCAAGI